MMSPSTACLNASSPKEEAAACGVRRPLGRYGDGFAQPRQQLLQPRLGALEGAGNARLGIHHEGQLAGKVVDDGDLLGEEQEDVGRAELVGFACLRQLRLDVAHRVVAEAADEAAAEARQAGARRQPETRHVLADEGERVAVVASLGDAVAGQHHDVAAVGGDARRCRQADEGITAEALAALHGFEQVGVRAVGQLEVDREGRVEVGEGFQGQRNAVVALGGQLVEFGFGHHDSTT
jgi:hypothetical protein